MLPVINSYLAVRHCSLVEECRVLLTISEAVQRNLLLAANQSREQSFQQSGNADQGVQTFTRTLHYKRCHPFALSFVH